MRANRPFRPHWPLALAATLALTVAACEEPDVDALSAEATAIFRECLERNGIEVLGVEVEVDADGKVGLIESQVQAGDIDYDTVRIGCTDEVEARLAED